LLLQQFFFVIFGPNEVVVLINTSAADIAAVAIGTRVVTVRGLQGGVFDTRVFTK
jgi:hypothetical protein